MESGLPDSIYESQGLRTDFPGQWLTFYREHGYIHIPGLIPPKIIKSIEVIVDNFVDTKIREWLDEGLLNDTFESRPRSSKFIEAWLAAGKPAYNRDALHYLINENMHEFLTQPLLLDLAQFLLQSSELSASGTQNIRVKHPLLPWTVVPWHADLFYWDEYHTQDPLSFIILWIPIQPVDETSGCLQVISMTRAKGSDFALKEEKVFLPDDLGEKLPYESIRMQVGDVLCMCDNVIHRSARNQEHACAWNIDIRYEVTEASGTITKQFGFIACSAGDDSKITPREEWLNKRQPKKTVTYSNPK